jgi:hypothetical protein
LIHRHGLVRQHLRTTLSAYAHDRRHRACKWSRRPTGDRLTRAAARISR